MQSQKCLLSDFLQPNLRLIIFHFTTMCAECESFQVSWWAPLRMSRWAPFWVYWWAPLQVSQWAPLWVSWWAPFRVSRWAPLRVSWWAPLMDFPVGPLIRILVGPNTKDLFLCKMFIFSWSEKLSQSLKSHWSGPQVI